MPSRQYWRAGQDGGRPPAAMTARFAAAARRRRVPRPRASRRAHDRARPTRACSTMPALRARVFLMAAVCIVLVAAAPARGAQQVSYAALLKQIKTGPLIRAVINRAGGDIEIKFNNLAEWKAFYAPAAQPMLQR